MSKLLVLIVLFMGLNAFAATLNLNGGETATISANVSTTVSCGGNGGGGGGGNCEAAGASFKKTMEFCYKSSNGGECAKKHWPTFKSSNPRCSYAGTDTCLEYCFKSYNGGQCADLCQ